ncbi:MAG: hypothetical protein MUF51_06365, partial [Vicinamibacteria bacterium]|nr:hypothetical protein [Vicinamibacteria bacterium]
EQMTDLERSITPTLNNYASDATHMSLVREPCRKRLAEFVRTWLLHEDQWRTDRFTAVTVVFEDEPALDPANRPPTLKIE